MRKPSTKLEQSRIQRRRAARASPGLIHGLTELGKEVNCLHTIANLLQVRGISSEDAIQGTVDIVPSGWQYPEITCARVVLEGKEFRTSNFKRTGWVQSSDVVVGHKPIGKLEVYYLEGKIEADEGPFLNEERDLIRSVAQELARTIERKRAEEHLKIMESAIASSINAIGLANFYGYLNYVNHSLVRMWGYDNADELLGKPTRILWHSLEKAMEVYRVICDVGGWIGELAAERKDGTTFDVHLSASKVTDDFGNPICMMATIIDVTERKQAEKKILGYQRRLQSLYSEMSLSEERQRRHIAQDLHDCTGQSFSLCKLRLEALRKSLSAADFAKPLDEIIELVNQMIQEARSLIFKLSPPILYELGLEPAVGWLAEQLAQEYVIPCDFENDTQPKPVNEDVKVMLFQVVRELLANIAKHSGARSAKICISRVNDTMRISVEDNGAGFDPDEAALYTRKIPGFGLFSIRQRLIHIGGSFEIESDANGTLVILTAPLKGANKTVVSE